jgi:putative ABC transport system permease protein
MMLLQNFKMALASIRASKLRSFLTMLGIIIGVSSVVTVIAAGAGVKKAVSDQVSSFGTNLIQVNPGKSTTEDEEGNAQGFNFTAGLGASTLTEADVESIQKLPNVEQASPALVISGVPKAGDKQLPGAFVLATHPNMLEIINRKIAKGSFFNQAQANEHVVALGHGAAEKLFPNQDPLGQKVSIRGSDFTVVGVLEAEKSSGLSLGPSFNEVIYMPFNSGKTLSGGVANILEIDIKARDAAQIEQTVKDVKSTLKQNHRGEEDFTVLTSEDFLKIFDTILGLMTSFVTAIAGISLLVGGIGVMNIMFVSVTERTREIGIRKAIGATRGNILTQFLIESMVVSLIGGLLGVALALAMGAGIKAAADFSPVFSANAFITAVVISLVIGIIFGTAPAIKAARKNPIEALRYE